MAFNDVIISVSGISYEDVKEFSSYLDHLEKFLVETSYFKKECKPDFRYYLRLYSDGNKKWGSVQEFSEN